MLEYLTSAHNQRIKAWASLKERKYREQTGTYLIEGLRSVQTYMDHGADLVALLVDHTVISATGERMVEECERQGIPVFALATQLLAHVSDTVHPQGIMAVVKSTVRSVRDVFTYAPEVAGHCSDVWLVIDGVRDPGNLGTLIRTAAAVGTRGIISLKGTVDFFNPKVVRATMGALAAVAVAESSSEDLLDSIRLLSVRLIGADAHAKRSLYEMNLTGRIGLVIGSEANGISSELQDSLSESVSLPMPGSVESLNAGVASSVMLYEALRQRLLM